jgi:broad specificity phosphatase PhoE
MKLSRALDYAVVLACGFACVLGGAYILAAPESAFDGLVAFVMVGAGFRLLKMIPIRVKPDKIIIVRHGESVLNADRTQHQKIPNFAATLTDLGRKQARTAAQAIRLILEPGTGIQYYVSPFWRTRQTYEELSLALSGFPARHYEDPRLREQEWGIDFIHTNSRDDYEKIVQRRDYFGSFYYRLPNGESCADVFDRISDFFSTLFRDFTKVDFPRNVIVVTHGMTMRLFLMRWFHLTVEEFERLANPLNCEFYLMTREPWSEHYGLVTRPRRYRRGSRFRYPAWKKHEPRRS